LIDLLILMVPGGGIEHISFELLDYIFNDLLLVVYQFIGPSMSFNILLYPVQKGG